MRAAPTQAISSHTGTDVKAGVEQHCERALVLATSVVRRPGGDVDDARVGRALPRKPRKARPSPFVP